MIEIIVIQEKKIIDRLKTEKDKITIGRDSENDIVLPDEYVSGLHAEITMQEDESVIVEDKESTNGTFINGKKIAKAQAKDNFMIKIEAFDIKVNLKPESSAGVQDIQQTIVIPTSKKTTGKKYYL